MNRQLDADVDGLDIDRLQWGTLRDWGQLVRLPNTFTLFSDCLAAAIVAGSRFAPLTALLPTVVASLFAYWAGMILNDVVDIEEDRETRASRPLVAGRISPALANHIATAMLLLGPGIILLVNSFHEVQQLWFGAAFGASVLLSMTVRAYNSVLKSTPLGPVLMGLCRTLNILMVGFTMLAVNGAEAIPQMPLDLLLFAAGIGLYILGVTIYASQEERESSSAVLVIGILFEIAGLAAVALAPKLTSAEQVWTLDPVRGFPLLIALIGLTVVNRGLSGVWHPVSRKVQLAVRHAILTLILVDAAVVLAWEGPWFGAVVLALLIPALTSALRFRST
ncbi:UbiA family prenyltransferase [Aureliella helgolandensis]|uniref:Prenyltransferase n=1 Tax=Aureliella helgolandensis TaxID=2527968 RepID=A0A518GFC8_9BACT|nr:UbiA family prenyltransferase [Aureliella helgolandensis]QDV27260.1 prenyltransferase [Aureliella helgolandensis]